MRDIIKQRKRTKLKRQLRNYHLFIPRLDILKQRLSMARDEVAALSLSKKNETLDEKELREFKKSNFVEEVQELEQEINALETNQRKIKFALSYITPEQAELIEMHIMNRIPTKKVAEKFFLHPKTVNVKILKAIDDMIVVLGY